MGSIFALQVANSGHIICPKACQEKIVKSSRPVNLSVHLPASHRKKFCKLGRKDSNLRMLESESSALPLGDYPISVLLDSGTIIACFHSKVKPFS